MPLCVWNRIKAVLVICPNWIKLCNTRLMSHLKCLGKNGLATVLNATSHNITQIMKGCFLCIGSAEGTEWANEILV